MSSRWRATMNRHSPPEGQAEIVLSVKTADGGRQEVSGLIGENNAMSLFFKAVQYHNDMARKKRRENDA